MAKKVTVSIPDLLHEKMEKWRASFNLSKMFQDAITEAIQKKEDFQKRIREDLDLSQVVERLRAEKMQSEGNYQESGRHDGMQWAKSAHYEDLIYALDWQDYPQATEDRILGEYFGERVRQNKLMSITAEGVNECFQAYLLGWKNGVDQFWQEVSDKL